MGLTRMTITNLASTLLDRGVLQEVDPPVRRPGPGRIAKVLRAGPESPVVAGLWFSKNHVYGVLADCELNVLVGRRIVFDHDEELDSILPKCLALAEEILKFTARPVIGLGLALAGVVDEKTGTVERLVDFHGLQSWPVSEYLSEHLAVPVIAHNMMHASALAETYYGRGQVLPRFIYLGITDGVGAAIVDRDLHGDAQVTAGEFGHMSIDYQGPACECGGRGCLELFASMPRIVEAIAEATGCDFTERRAALALCARDERAGEVLREILHKVAAGLNNLINFRNIFTIVVGDDSFHIPEQFLTGMVEELNRITLFHGLHEITFQRSQFEDNGPLFGSVALVMDRVFSGKLKV